MEDKLLEALNEIFDFDVVDYVNIEDLIEDPSWDNLSEMVENNGGLNEEVIYYSEAIKYLAENDPSLYESLELAAECGYSLTDLSSETLASLLASQKRRESFWGCQDDWEEFVESLN